MADEEETIEDSGASDAQDSDVAVDDGGDEAAASYAGPAAKPKPDIFSLLLILTFAAFFVGTWLTANELHDFYKVNFWVLK